jgi:hypothetical protein
VIEQRLEILSGIELAGEPPVAATRKSASAPRFEGLSRQAGSASAATASCSTKFRWTATMARHGRDTFDCSVILYAGYKFNDVSSSLGPSSSTPPPARDDGAVCQSSSRTST